MGCRQRNQPHAQAFLYEFGTALAMWAFVRVHAFLRERDNLYGHDVLELFLELKQGLKGGEVGVGHVGVGADVLHTVAQLHRDGLAGTALDLIDRKVGFGVAPPLNAFEQRTAFVHGAWLAGGEHVIEVQVCVAERRAHEFATQINHFHVRHVVPLGSKRGRKTFTDGGNATVLRKDVLQWCGLRDCTARLTCGDVRIDKEGARRG